MEALIHIIKEFFEALYKIFFGEYKKLQTGESLREFSSDILVIFRNILFFLWLYLSIEQGCILIEYFKHSSHLKFDWVPALSLFVALTLWWLARVGIRKIKESVEFEDFYIENQKVQIDSIYTQSLSLNNKFSKKHNISYSFFTSWGNKQNDYTEFIKELQKATQIAPEPLINIGEIAKKSTYGHFKCVIAYLDFFEDDDEFQEMVNYFAKYEKVASNNKNIVQRIFTIPGAIKTASESYYKTKWNIGLNQEKNYYLYCYLVLNKICACDTYLLVYEEVSKSKLTNRFLHNVDYVLAYKNQPDNTENDIELFFAYPEDEVNDLNRTIKIDDSYFIRMFELDFKKRMELTPTDETPTTFLKFNKSNKSKILSMLNLDVRKDKIALNAKMDMMKIQLTQNDFFNPTIPELIEDWKIK